jgi:hypothetical protein
VADVVVLPGLACCGLAGGDGVPVDEDFDGADVAFEVAKDNLQRMLAAIPLTDDERAAVDDGQAALDKLLGRLADTPTPAGPTPARGPSRRAASPPNPPRAARLTPPFGDNALMIRDTAA